MKTKEFGEVKELDAMKRHSFVRSVLKGKIEQRRKLAEMKSTLNQKALRAKMMESVMKPSLQNVLTVDLVSWNSQYYMQFSNKVFGKLKNSICYAIY